MSALYPDASTDELFAAQIERERRWALRMVDAGTDATPEQRATAWLFLLQDRKRRLAQ